MGAKIYQDAEGNVSSKRITGICSLSIGFLMGVLLFFFAVFVEVKEPTLALQVFVTFMSTGGALLGIGVAETIKINRIKKKVKAEMKKQEVSNEPK